MKVPMDSLVLLSSWNNTSTGMSIVTAKLNGIYIQGARMTSQIEECNKNSPSWNPTPSCLVSWIHKETVKYLYI